MKQIKRIIAIVISLLTLFCLSTPALAASTGSNGNTAIKPQNVNPYEYGNAPDGVYVFIYRGTAPYKSMEIDTASCVVNRLYVYDASKNTIEEVTAQAVTEFTETKDALYYVTEAQAIYKTDYTGNNHELLYQSSNGVIKQLDSYFSSLFFIENNNRIVLWDNTTKQAQTILTCDDLAWVFLLSDTEYLYATLAEEHYIYDSMAKTSTPLSSMEATDRINEAVLSEEELAVIYEEERSNASRSSSNFGNDKLLPLSSYPAYSSATIPSSWFHKNDLEGCDIDDNCIRYGGTNQCEGFARYAHDTYFHIAEVTSYSSWRTSKHPDGRYDFDTTTDVSSFFEDLNKGAYIRYGRDDDQTPSNGMHSIVFASINGSGIWAYECNQSYYDYLTPEQIGGHPEEYFGCGVFYRFYSFEALKTRYNYVLHSINHTFAGEWEYYNGTYHRQYCLEEGCSAYIQMKHPSTDISKVVDNAVRHRSTFSCCNTSRYFNHSGTATYSLYSDSKHKVTFSCCTGYILQDHVYTGTTRPTCKYCGKVKDLNIRENSTEKEEPFLVQTELK